MLCLSKELTWYWNRWSNVWFAPTNMSMIAIINPKQTYRIDWTDIICAMSNNGSHCVFRKPVFIFIVLTLSFFVVARFVVYMMGEDWPMSLWHFHACTTQNKVQILRGNCSQWTNADEITFLQLLKIHSPFMNDLKRWK